MNTATCAVFFASGAAALLFETLWFRQAGLMLGNTVWASALVLAGFMAGLAIGNAFAIRVGWSAARPLRLFAGLELVVGVTGAGLVLAMPGFGQALAPVFSRLEGSAGLDALRLVSTFVLLIVPASAMGATLPVLARSLGARDSNFGRLLGRLYGWNTLGAVAGSLAGEGFLIHWLGVSGTALFAGALDLVAACGAVLLDRRQPPLATTPVPSATAAGGATRLLAAAFLAGFLLLALEVVWVRFLLMFVWGTSLAFAIMLAVVLLGIGSGGVLASLWLGRRPEDRRHATPLALAAGVLTVVSYATFGGALPSLGAGALDASHTVLASLWLMFPVSTASGALFTLLGQRLRADMAEDAQAAGTLALSNTVGAMLGSLLAGFVLLPLVGMEVSFFALSCGYGVVAALALPPSGPVSAGRRQRIVAFGLLAAALVLFPFGALRGRYLSYVDAYWRRLEGSRVVAMKEGLSETVFLLRRERLGLPLSWRMLTNGTSMSTTEGASRRYMGLFVWLPVALHPGPRSALLISYGLGNTARTLAATAGLKRVDVVDVSPDVLRLSPIVWPEPRANPLRDPRFRVHIEDARFFLLASRERYDLITGEPPPPKSAGIVNLYSREYFRLMYARLAEGGIASYWLPVLHLHPRETFAVANAFCAAFADCSLWTGWGHEWVLLGSRGAARPAERFAQQWNDPVVAARLKAAGLESPAQLGATFLADAATLAREGAEAAPLADDFPYRIDPRHAALRPSNRYAELMETGKARERFRASGFVRSHWPAPWAEASLPAFDAQRLINRIAWTAEGVIQPGGLPYQAEVLSVASPTVALWALGSSVEEQDLATRAAERGVSDPQLYGVLGQGALARRDWAEAEALLSRAERDDTSHALQLRLWRILAAGLAGDRARAARLLAEAGPIIESDRSSAAAEAWSWLAQRFELALPGHDGP